MKTATLTQQQNYHSSIDVNIDAKEAYEKISRVNEWWALDFEGSAKEMGDIFIIRFGDTFVAFKIAETIPGRKITWHVIDSWLPWLDNRTEWTDTDVVFDISPKKASTKIDMTHIGLTPNIECYDRCEKGWNYFIKESLFKFVIDGAGLPE